MAKGMFATTGRLSGLKAVARAVKASSTPGGAALPERLAALPRLGRAVARGQYQGVTPAQLALLTAAAAYVASPVDLLPEALVGAVGLADDAVVLSWFARTLITVTDEFLAWEKRTGATLTGERVR